MFCLSMVTAQIHEIGPFVGGSNFIGDIGKTNYIKPNEYAFGFIYKYNRSPRHSYRFSYIRSNVTANDDASPENSRQLRSLDFKNHVSDLMLGLEFNFFDFNLHNLDNQFTPYVSTGVAYTFYDALYYPKAGATNDIAVFEKKRRTFGIPMIVGVKSRIGQNWVLAGEVNIRYTLVDDIDGSNPTNADFTKFKFGNIDSNDWITFVGLTLTYTFGNKPCYCEE